MLITDDAELERGLQIRPEHLGAEQDSATKADATQALANEVVALLASHSTAAQDHVDPTIHVSRPMESIAAQLTNPHAGKSV